MPQWDHPTSWRSADQIRSDQIRSEIAPSGAVGGPAARFTPPVGGQPRRLNRRRSGIRHPAGQRQVSPTATTASPVQRHQRRQSTRCRPTPPGPASQHVRHPRRPLDAEPIRPISLQTVGSAAAIALPVPVKTPVARRNATSGQSRPAQRFPTPQHQPLLGSIANASPGAVERIRRQSQPTSDEPAPAGIGLAGASGSVEQPVHTSQPRSGQNSDTKSRPSRRLPEPLGDPAGNRHPNPPRPPCRRPSAAVGRGDNLSRGRSGLQILSRSEPVPIRPCRAAAARSVLSVDCAVRPVISESNPESEGEVDRPIADPADPTVARSLCRAPPPPPDDVPFAGGTCRRASPRPGCRVPRPAWSDSPS